ncbi:hypothetical protein BUALT_Bualt12G0063600 [Buddleja alternifolia]|uniref:Retrotransposon gag domain-containing protein n=1 Tax=Buddleja alternifolia TaxID=168488 RepID=A0AAV6WZT2_9LAMI|nr:hypothetical protein BUALT_Bualt12G0063600 [Buddleja alternifolia]
MPQNKQPPAHAYGQPPIPQPGLKLEDLLAIATVVAQMIQGQQRTKAAAQPATKGIKAHYETLRKAHVPTFDGDHDPKGAQKWLKEIEDNFELIEIPIEVRPKVIVPFLVGEVARHFFPNTIRLQKMVEFDSIMQQSDVTLLEYSAKFHYLGKYSPTIMGDPQLKIYKFTNGLKSQIQSALVVFKERNFDELLGAAIRAEADIKKRDE